MWTVYSDGGCSVSEESTDAIRGVLSAIGSVEVGKNGLMRDIIVGSFAV